MTQTPGFDPHATIRKLAEAEWPDLSPASSRLVNERGATPIVPFASLRVARCVKKGRHFHYTVCYNSYRGNPCDEGWIPEPDVEKACWRVFYKVMDKVPGGITYWIGVARLRREDERWWDAEECWLRAAEAWLDEQMKAVQP